MNTITISRPDMLDGILYRNRHISNFANVSISELVEACEQCHAPWECCGSDTRCMKRIQCRIAGYKKNATVKTLWHILRREFTI